ncbi:MAG: hypothetical protein K2N82_13910 [Lachnospiraceae bacterium]|nr:hypothetical protein [Lachnospiraceae bacterium]
MRLEEQYQELLRLKREIDQRLKMGTDFGKIKELMLYLAQDKAYFKLKEKENQMIMLECFFNIWLREKKKLPDLGVETDIFHKVSSLDDMEQKYQRIKYCGLRIENAVPGDYIEQALEQLIEEQVSGIAIGTIIRKETEKREQNILSITHYLRQRGDSLNALLLIQYANEKFPGEEKLLLEEADIWLEGQHFERVLELLSQIKNPSMQIKGLIEELRQVTENDR